MCMNKMHMMKYSKSKTQSVVIFLAYITVVVVRIWKDLILKDSTFILTGYSFYSITIIGIILVRYAPTGKNTRFHQELQRNWVIAPKISGHLQRKSAIALKFQRMLQNFGANRARANFSDTVSSCEAWANEACVARSSSWLWSISVECIGSLEFRNATWLVQKWLATKHGS